MTSVEVSASLRETLHHLLRRNEDEEEDYDEGSEVENSEFHICPLNPLFLCVLCMFPPAGRV